MRKTYFNKKDHLWTLYEYGRGYLKFLPMPDAFCAAENIVLQATELCISSRAISRAEETFDNEYGKALLCKWNIPENLYCAVLRDSRIY